MSGWTFPLSSGVELTERAIRIALGEPPGTLTPRWERTSAERAVISIPGTVRMTTGAETVRRRDEIAALFISAVPGSDARLPTNNVEKSGNVIAVADDRGVATRAAEAGVAGIEVVLEPENRSTNDFLFGEPGRYWAFGPGSFDRRWLNRIKLDSDRSVVFEPGLIAEAGAAWRGAGPVGIGPLPPGSEIRDWAWRSLADTVGVLSAEGLVSTDRFDERLAPLVWRAVLRGGLQGGRYVLGGRE